jgi:hypothetical protein
MVRMTVEGFQSELNAKQDSAMLGPCLRDDIVPYVFAAKPIGWDQFRTLCGQRFGIAKENMTIVGSGRFGFSMKPYSRLKPFTERSDIDVLVVNAELFDSVWYQLLKMAYPRNYDHNKIGGFLAERRSECYTGFFDPHEIRLDGRYFGLSADPIRDFRTRWFDLLKAGSNLAVSRHESIKGRLYRTWQHAEFYHLDSLASLRRSLKT